MAENSIGATRAAGSSGGSGNAVGVVEELIQLKIGLKQSSDELQESFSNNYCRGRLDKLTKYEFANLQYELSQKMKHTYEKAHSFYMLLRRHGFSPDKICASGAFGGASGVVVQQQQQQQMLLNQVLQEVGQIAMNIYSIAMEFYAYICEPVLCYKVENADEREEQDRVRRQLKREKQRMEKAMAASGSGNNTQQQEQHLTATDRDRMRNALRERAMQLEALESSAGTNVATKIIPLNLLFLIISKLLLSSRQTNGVYKQYGHLMASSFEYAVDNMLIRAPQASILSYNQLELIDSVHQLAFRWPQLDWDPELLSYIELLEYRCSVMLCEAQTSEVHNIKTFSTELAAVEALAHGRRQPLYTFNEAFLCKTASLFVNFRLRMSLMQVAPHTDELPERWRLDQREDVDPIEQWLKRQARNVYGDKIGTDFRKIYYKRCLRPGEYEEYKRRLPHEAVTDQRVIQTIRGDQELKNVQAFCNREEYEEFLSDDELEYPASRPTMAHLLMSSYFTGAFPGTDWSRYCMFAEDIYERFSELPRVQDPILVQTFNFFHVYFRGTVYRVGRFYDCVALWIKMVEQDCDGKIEHGELSIFEMLQVVYGVRHPRTLAMEQKIRDGNHRLGVTRTTTTTTASRRTRDDSSSSSSSSSEEEDDYMLDNDDDEEDDDDWKREELII